MALHYNSHERELKRIHRFKLVVHIVTVAIMQIKNVICCDQKPCLLHYFDNKFQLDHRILAKIDTRSDFIGLVWHICCVILPLGANCY